MRFESMVEETIITMLVISDGVITKYDNLTSKIDRYNEWKRTHGEKV